VAMSDALAAILEGTGFAEGDVPDLKRVVGADADEELASRLEALRSVAFAEYLQWATAQRRFGSISELDTARVLALFLNVRRSALSVETLVEDLGIPQARATSMIGRMRYGEGRALAALSFAAAAADVEARLAEAPEEDHRKSITTTREVVDRVSEVEFAILSSPAKDLGKGGKYESAEALSVISSGRYGSTVSTSTKTWDYILAELKVRGGV
jgi:hypothetical protein